MRKLVRSTRGAAMVEYIILLGLIAVLSITMAARIGWNLSFAYNGSAAAISNMAAATSGSEAENPLCPEYPGDTTGFLIGTESGESVVLMSGEPGACSLGGYDSLIGNGGANNDEILVPGPGGSFSMGYAGNDTYYLNMDRINGPYFGYNQVQENPGQGANDRVIFAGLNASDAAVRWHQTGPYLYDKTYTGSSYDPYLDVGDGNGVLIVNGAPNQPPEAGPEWFEFDDLTMNRAEWEAFTVCGLDPVRVNGVDAPLTAAGACGLGGTNTYRYEYATMGSWGLVFVAETVSSYDDTIVFSDWMPEDVAVLHGGLSLQDFMIIDRTAFEADNTVHQGVWVRNVYQGAGAGISVENFEWADGSTMTRDEFMAYLTSQGRDPISVRDL